MPIPGKQLSVLLRVPDDPNNPSTVRNTRLDLPAEPTEILDALHRLGRNRPDEDIEVRIEDTSKPYLRYLLGTTSNNLMELDLLARRLADVTFDDTTVFQALVSMNGQITDIPRLINLTHAIETCHVASNVSNWEQLGRFLLANDMLTEEETQMAMVKLASSQYDNKYFALLGREYRDAAHGVIVGNYYVECPDWPDIREVYRTEMCSKLQLPEHSLEADFYTYPWVGDEPDKVIHAAFPLSQQALDDILAELGTTSDDLVISPTSCLIPEMMHCIELDAAVSDLNAFAVCMDGLQAQGKLPLYKALLDAHECEDIQMAAQLGVRVREYELIPGISNPAQYARHHFNEQHVDAEIQRLAEGRLYEYGKQVLRDSNDFLTAYGLLRRRDGGPVLVQMEADVGSREYSITKVHHQLDENYDEYMDILRDLEPYRLIQKAREIAATELVYEQLRLGDWPDEVYEKLSRDDYPLLQARNRWMDATRDDFDAEKFLDAIRQIGEPAPPSLKYTMEQTM